MNLKKQHIPLLIGFLAGVFSSVTIILLRGGYNKYSVLKIVLVKLFLIIFYMTLIPYWYKQKRTERR